MYFNLFHLMALLGKPQQQNALTYTEFSFLNAWRHWAWQLKFWTNDSTVMPEVYFCLWLLITTVGEKNKKKPVIIIINDLTFDSDGVRSHFRSILVGCFTPVKVRVFQEDGGEGEGQWWWGGWFDSLKLHPVSAQHQCWGRSSIWETAKGHVTTLHQLLVWPN